MRIQDLELGPLYHFRDWPNRAVPQVAAGVYTIWQDSQLVYVVMSGRGLTTEGILAHREAKATGKGLFSRLNSHASGRRSGDQFCVYVCDRLVLPRLIADEIARVANGNLSLDQLVRRFIHEHLSYRYSETPNGAAAMKAEAAIRRGALSAGKPVLNPLR